jgi:hypothetical protein
MQKGQSMSASRRVLESVARPYSAAVLDAAVERQARRGPEGSLASPGPRPSFAEPYREAHLESVSSRSAPSTVRAAALERLGAHLAADENFGRKLSKDAARALNGVDYLTDREKHILSGVDARAWAALAAASDKFKVAVGKKAAAGVPAGPSQVGDYLNGFQFGGAAGTYGWGDVKTPGGQGITLSTGKKIGGHAGGGASSGAGPGSGDDGGRGGGGLGTIGDLGGYRGHGDAGQPSAPTGGPGGGYRPTVVSKGGLPENSGVEHIGTRAGWAAEVELNPPKPVEPAPPLGLPPTAPAHITVMVPTSGGESKERTFPLVSKKEWKQYLDKLHVWEDRRYWYNMRELEEWKLALQQLPPANPPKEPPPEPPPDPTAIPNPEGTGGPGPVGPWSREGARDRQVSLGFLLPNPEGTGGGGPVNPWSRGASRGAYTALGRYAMPNPEGTGNPGPVGPSLRADEVRIDRNGDVMPNPDDPRGPTGPSV